MRKNERKVLELLKKRGEKIVLCSSFPEEWGKFLIEKLKIREYFDLIIFCDDKETSIKSLIERNPKEGIIVLDDKNKEIWRKLGAKYILVEKDEDLKKIL